MTAAAMWQRYAWQGHEVVVIQQWTDPFGCRMVRIASATDGATYDENAASGMTEAAFLAEAEPLHV